MAWNESFWCPKHVSNPYVGPYHRNMFRSDFGKIDFLVDFHIFYLWVTGKKPSKTSKNRDKPLKPIKTYSWLSGPSPKNFSWNKSPLFARNHFLTFWGTKMRFGPKMHIYRFTPLKALKIQKFSDFRKLHIFCYKFIFYGFSISPTVKKIWALLYPRFPF